MRPGYLVQAVGVTTVTSAFLASEAAARLLAVYPASETLWYLQLGLLRPLSILRMSSPAVDAFLDVHALMIGVGALVVIWAACCLKQRLVVGLMAHCSVLLVAMTAYLWSLTATGQTASLVPLAPDAPVPNLLLLSALGAMAGIACVASHLGFIRAIRTESSAEAP